MLDQLVYKPESRPPTGAYGEVDHEIFVMGEDCINGVLDAAPEFQEISYAAGDDFYAMADYMIKFRGPIARFVGIFESSFQVYLGATDTVMPPGCGEE